MYVWGNRHKDKWTRALSDVAPVISFSWTGVQMMSEECVSLCSPLSENPRDTLWSYKQAHYPSRLSHSWALLAWRRQGTDRLTQLRWERTWNKGLIASCFHPAGPQTDCIITGLFLGKGGLFQAQDKALAPLWQADQAGIWVLPMSKIWTRSRLNSL